MLHAFPRLLQVSVIAHERQGPSYVNQGGIHPRHLYPDGTAIPGSGMCEAMRYQLAFTRTQFGYNVVNTSSEGVGIKTGGRLGQTGLHHFGIHTLDGKSPRLINRS